MTVKNIVSGIILLLGITVLTGCFSKPAPLTQPQKQLIQAIQLPDKKADLKKYISALEDSNVNFQIPENGRTPLMTAVIQRDSVKMQTLLDAGADTAIRDNNNMTALHYAAELDNPEFAKLLLTAKTDINAEGRNGKTPLMDACRLGNMDTVKLLLENGADTACRDDNGRDAAMLAAGAPKNSLALLAKTPGLAMPADLKQAGVVIAFAVDAGNTETAMELLKSFPEDISSDKSATLGGLWLMQRAIKANNEKVIKELIRRKLPLNTSISVVYQTLKSFSLGNVYKTLAKYEAIDSNRTPLSRAAEYDNPALIKLLLAAGANPLCKDNNGCYPIEYTRRYDTHKMLKDAMKEAQR